MTKIYKVLQKHTIELLQAGESTTLDYKKKFKIDPEDFVAFANTKGGVLLIGVDEKVDETGRQYGEVVGCKVNDSFTRQITNKASTCRPSIEVIVTIENLNYKPIYRIDIPEGNDKPYCTSNGTYKYRMGTQNTAIDPTMMSAIILERESDAFIQRFKSVGEELVAQIQRMHRQLSYQVDEVQEKTSLITDEIYSAVDEIQDAINHIEDNDMMS